MSISTKIITKYHTHIILQMSFKAVFEVFLQIHQFWNVDLPCQGIFKLRASLYQQNEKQITYATPFQFMNPIQSSPSKKIRQMSSIEPPYFYSKGGLIKYSDEQLQFKDEARFKLEVESFPRLHSEQIYIRFQLIFHQLTHSSSQVIAQQGEIVETKNFKLDTIQHGLCSYFQAQFVGNYSSKFSFTLFACLSNFQFGKYKLFNQISAIGVQGEDGTIKIDPTKSSESVRTRQLERSKVKNFDQFMTWVSKYYKDRLASSPLSYFYNTYIKNLRYYFYLSQQKFDENSLEKLTKTLKVPKQFLELPTSAYGQTEVSEKDFRKYMTSYQPKQLTPTKLLQQINTIYGDIYMFLIKVENLMRQNLLMKGKMQKQFQAYVKDRYGERVFRNIIKGNLGGGGSRENKKIAKKMREKQGLSTVTYPIEDVAFLQSKQTMEYLFYEITYPTQKQQNKKKNEFSQNLSQKQNGVPILQNQFEKKENEDDNIFSNINQNSECHSQIYEPEKQEENLLQKINVTNTQENQQITKKAQQILQKQNKQQCEQKEGIPTQKTREIERKQPIQNKKDNIKHDQYGENLDKQAQIGQMNFKTLAEQIQYLRSLEKQKRGSKQVVKQQKQGKQHRKQSEDQYGDEDEDEDENDPYANITHEKGSVDSEMTEKSFQKQCFQNKMKKLADHFEGISDIEIKYDPTIHQLPSLNYNENNMLIVLCHGFQGSSYDMTIILRGLKQALPNAFYLLSKSNEGNTEGDIEEMGQRLAEEVQNYVQNYLDKNTVILNFVGHSMGGVVARTATKYLMKEYWNQFGFYCSLSSPHLGYLNGVDGMIKAGLWAILKFKPIKSLQQLKMDDEKNIQNSFLYKLSKQGHLKRFRKIILFSSFEDSYVSWHSARISAHSSKSSKFTKLEQEMVKYILGDSPIHRIDVNFNVQTKNIDSFIGRTAHINLIIQQSLFKIINTTIPNLFDLQSQ